MVCVFWNIAVGWRYGEKLDRKDCLALFSSLQSLRHIEGVTQLEALEDLA